MNRKRYIAFIFMLMLLLAAAACSDKKNENEKAVADEPTVSDEIEDDGNDDGNSEEDEEAEGDAVDEVTAAPLPQSLAELAERLPGHTTYLNTMDSEDQKKIDELTKDLPDISGNPTENELDHFYNELLATFQQDFMGPEELIAKLKFQGIGEPDIGNPRMEFKENLNVLVILDASGSMGKFVGGQTQMDAAKKAILQFLESLPKDANVGLRVYGHEGTGSSADKAMSCSSSELIYPLQPYDKAGFKQSLDPVKPAGWTPTELALMEAQKDLAEFDGANNTNIVYLVGDGISTCDDDPVAAAKALYDSEITPIINVIGFNVDDEGQKQLKAVAKAVEGTYQDVQDAESLQDELDQAKEVAKKWADWKKDKGQKLSGQRVSNGLEIFIYDSKEYKKVVNERQRVGFTIQYLYQKKKLMSKESHDYLREKNTAYHDWMQAEYDALRAELKSLNEMQYTEAIEALEEKYLQNTPD